MSRGAAQTRIVGALHAAIYWNLNQWVGAKCTKFLLVAIPLQLLAVTASFGTHWTHMQGGNATRETYRKTQLQAVDDLLSFVQSYQGLADETKALASHSEQQAAIEAATGTSCGSSVGSGRGPRYRLRMSDKAIFDNFELQISGRMGHLEELGQKATALTAQSADDAMNKVDNLGSIVAQAKSYRGDWFLTTLRNAALLRLSSGARAFSGVTPAGKAENFSCPDSVLDRHLQSIVDAIDGLKPISDIVVKDARDPKVGYAFALGRIFTTLFSAHVSPPPRDELRQQRVDQLHPRSAAPEGIRDEDMAPLAFAVGIEALLTRTSISSARPI